MLFHLDYFGHLVVCFHPILEDFAWVVQSLDHEGRLIQLFVHDFFLGFEDLEAREVLDELGTLGSGDFEVQEGLLKGFERGLGDGQEGVVSLLLECVQRPEEVLNEVLAGRDELFVFGAVGHLFASLDHHLTIDHVVVDLGHAQDGHGVVETLVVWA